MKKICVFVICVLLLSGGTIMASAQAGDDSKPSVYYIQAPIRSGDTLWSIAARYCPQGESTETYVQKIETLNQMTSDAIFAGDSLILPICR